MLAALILQRCNRLQETSFIVFLTVFLCSALKAILLFVTYTDQAQLPPSPSHLIISV